MSASVGRRGAWLTLGRRGVRANVGIPGTGLSYSQQSPWARPKPHVPGIEVTELPHLDEIEVPPVLPRAQNVALAQSEAVTDRGRDVPAAHEQSEDETDPRLLPIALVIATIVAIVAIGWTFLV